MMMEKRTTEFLEELSSSSPAPGGGGASAAVGAFAAALGLMVANLTLGKKKYADVEEEIQEAKENLLKLRDRLIQLVDDDAKGFEPLAAAYRLPKETEEQRQYKEKIMEKALYDASLVPMQIMETTLTTMELLKVMGEKGSKLAASDAGVGIVFAQAALEGASLNVFINSDMMKDRECAEALNKKVDEMIAAGNVLKEEVYSSVLSKIRR